MNIKTKKTNYPAFIKAQLGEDSYKALVFFGENILFMDRLLILKGVVLDEFEKKLRKPQVPENQRQKIGQIGQLDTLASIMMMVEGLFVLIHSFRTDPKDVYKNLQKYSKNEYWPEINGLINHTITPSDFWKVFADFSTSFRMNSIESE
jgi:hypothetical protein